MTAVSSCASVEVHVLRTFETAYKADDTSLTTSPASDKTSNFTSDAVGMIPMTNLFEVSTRRVSDDYRIECSGELDISTVDKLEDAIDNCFSDDAPASLYVDLSPVSFFGAAGVMLLVRTAHRCRDLGIDLRVSVAPIAWRVLEIVGMDELASLGAKITRADVPYGRRRAHGTKGESRPGSSWSRQLCDDHCLMQTTPRGSQREILPEPHEPNCLSHGECGLKVCQ